MRIAEGVAALRREAHAAHDVQPAALHVRDALVVVAVDVVKVPVGVADDGLHPHFERARPLAVWRHLEEVAAAVRRHAHAPARLRDAEELLPQGVVPVDVVDVAFSPTNDEAGKMYNHQWNYAISYPIEGIIMEG